MTLLTFEGYFCYSLTTEWSAYKGEKCRGYYSRYYLSKPLLPHCQPPPPNRSRGPLRSPVTWPMLARRRVTGQVGVWREEGPLTISPPWENSVSGRTVDTNSWVLGAGCLGGEGGVPGDGVWHRDQQSSSVRSWGNWTQTLALSTTATKCVCVSKGLWQEHFTCNHPYLL